MKTQLTALLLLFVFASFGQEDDRSWRLGVFGGAASYQGDLQPNSFSFSQSNYMISAWVRKSVSNRVSLKAGLSSGKLGAADSNNREYLKPRNLSFETKFTEGFLILDYTMFDLSKTKLSPYGYLGLSIFKYNPFTYDQKGSKIYLKPLSTEGQGLPQYPDRKEYSLTQKALAFGGGLRYALNEHLLLSIDAGQRKTFTDYLDDVSSSYVDPTVLLAEKGPKAVELAYRTDEYFGNTSSPYHGEQRGTPKEMDWYYYLGLSAEVKLEVIGASLNRISFPKKRRYNTRCPINVL